MNLADTFIQSDLHCFQDNDFGIGAVQLELEELHVFIYLFIVNVLSNVSEQPRVIAIVL